MSFERKIPDTEISTTSKMMSKLFDSVICPATTRGKEVFKYARNGALIGAMFAESISAVAVGFRFIYERNSATCDYEQSHAASYNCSFDLKTYTSGACRNLIEYSDGDKYFPLTCVNDTNNSRRSALIGDASKSADDYANDWYLDKARETALWSAVAGAGAGAFIGGLYGLFKELPPRIGIEGEESRSESLLRNGR
jgi:hypothetical protein